MPTSFQIKTKADYEAAYKKSVEDPETFWSDIAKNFLWKKPWNGILPNRILNGLAGER